MLGGSDTNVTVFVPSVMEVVDIQAAERRSPLFKGLEVEKFGGVRLGVKQQTRPLAQGGFLVCM